ncbi:MAG: Rieske (2Fe-2S) protein [Dehalococcoidia bacterium]|nr:Rieske (2Fe-2S) protein [Dehalococcoidia bacterium]
MTDESKERKLNRRELLGLAADQKTARAIVGVIGAATGVRATVTDAMLGRKVTGAARDAFGRKLTAGKGGDYTVGDVIYFNTGRFYLSFVPEGYLALYRRCPHDGCIVAWRHDDPALEPQSAPQWQGAPKEGRFVCLCDGSAFDRYGVPRSGPAPRPLDLMKVDIQPDGTLMVDTADIAERTAFDPSQAKAR